MTKAATYRPGRAPIERHDFSKIPVVLDIPNLLDIQTSFYERFLQRNANNSTRKTEGLHDVFQSIFPIKDFNETATLEYLGYELGIWECKCGEYLELAGPGVVCDSCGKEVRYKATFPEGECIKRGLTFADPLKIKVQLIVKNRDEETGEESIREVKVQKIYLGEIPLMTDTGTFIINGTERVAVSQLHRSPGAFFTSEKGKGTQAGQTTYSARLIPYRGSWLDFEFDAKDILHARIDRRRKFPATILLKALGFDAGELLNFFYEKSGVTYDTDKDLFAIPVDKNLLSFGFKVRDDITDPGTGDVLLKAGKKMTRRSVKQMEKSGITTFAIEDEDLLGRYVGEDIVDEEIGEILIEVNTIITEETISIIRNRRIESIPVLVIEAGVGDTAIRDTLMVDKVDSTEDALKEIYKRMRPGDPPTAESAKVLFDSLFFSPKRYDLSDVGRLKLSNRLGSVVSKMFPGVKFGLDQRQITKEDIMAAVKVLIDLKRGVGSPDDIDHLGNRRVRSVGESVENQFRIGLVRMEKAIVERMNMMDITTCMPHDLINSKPVTAAIKEFFGSSQLSQFMDQTNPLSSVTHKRRLSALGPGGLTRERAGFEVRDVHPSHYGRICPIETPEGPNIGLISSLSTFAKVNNFGFIETPYRKVENKTVSGEILYLSAMEEDKFTIAQANAPLDEGNTFIRDTVICRKGGEYLMVPAEEVDYMDVSPKQLVSVAASMIPFLENDDANRALMGSNMQRQAVPLVQTEAPFVGTGMEGKVARDSGAVVTARNGGTIIAVDASRIVIRTDAKEAHERRVDIYDLIKYHRSNQNTCISQRPIVSLGQKVNKGGVIADGQSTDRGELALGRNVRVAFMPWHGYNFEDAIIISERLVRDNVFTSVHIEQFEVEARDTRQGKEDITREIPNVSEDSLKDLDESGIIRIGAKVKTGDVLVGKVTPKGETLLSPEEKLLKAIFGEKAGDVRDTSLTVPPGNEGTVINVKVFTRRGADKDSRTTAIEEEEITKLEKDRNDEVRIITTERDSSIRKILEDEKVAGAITNGSKTVIERGTILTPEILESISGKELLKVEVESDSAMGSLIKIADANSENIELVKARYEDLIAKFTRGDELMPGVIKVVKVYLAIKRKLQVGDKMAGRHGNKGVVSIIVPEEDMPFSEDGSPVDIILNPLGVPSRMNVGQIMETNLGMAASRLGRHMRTPVFDGANEQDICDLLEESGYPINGKIDLWDGRTGEKFYQKVMVGYIYILKLHHLVDDKIHARSTGPYSLVTQQPLGGKAQFGGQRLGEMEVWALEAYGAAYTLQEMLTVKSDDVEGRKRMYESIVKGDHSLHPGLPESFNVLVKELQALCLDVELLHDGSDTAPF